MVKLCKMFIDIKRVLGLTSYQPLNKIEISKNRLVQNYKYLSSKKIKIAPVVKSNAYGHGLVLVAKLLEEGCGDCHVPFFCVDSIYEAYELLKTKIKTPILIMGYIEGENLRVKKLPFSYAVSTLDLAEAINKYQPQAGVHIFVDTGMHREGIPLADLPQFITHLKQLPNINIEGLMSHLASADDTKDPLNKLQIKNFQRAHDICKKNGIHPKWIHILNSDGLLYTSDVASNLPMVPHRMCNIARVGLALYGISKDPNLKPVLTLKTKIIQIKNLQKGDRVGYDGTYTAKKPMTIGVLPLGYYDGADRRLSNKGFVTIDGVGCPIIGLISMNVTTIDLSKVKNPFISQVISQEVIVYSNNPKDPNSIENAAKVCKTIPYEILVHLASSTRRVVV